MERSRKAPTCRDTIVLRLYNLPTATSVRASATATRAAAVAHIDPSLSVDCFVVDAEEVVKRIARQRELANGPVFDAEEREVVAMLRRISLEERSAWESDEALARILRQRAGLSMYASRGWLYSGCALAIDTELRRNDH